MKNLILTILCVFTLSAFLFAQEVKEDLVLVESFEKPNCELLIAELDNLMIRTQNKPETSGYVVIHGGQNPIDNIIWERAVRWHLKLRKYDPKKISVLTTRSNQNFKIDLFVAANATKPTGEDENFSYVLPNAKPILFASDAVSIIKIDGKETYLNAGCEVCCLDSLDFNILSAFLEANPQLKAEIRIINRSKKMADKLSRIILDEAVNDYKISSDRINIKYGGKGKRDKSDSIEISDVETRLIPYLTKT